MGGRAKKMGGGMMMQRPMMKKGGAAKGAKPITDPKVLEAIKLIKPPKGKKRFGKMGGGMMKRPMMKEGGKLKMVTKNGKKVPFFAADGKGLKDLGKAAGAGAAAAKLGKTAGEKLKKLNPGLRSFMQKKMKNK
jgi:hypothetical protein